MSQSIALLKVPLWRATLLAMRHCLDLSRTVVVEEFPSRCFLILRIVSLLSNPYSGEFLHPRLEFVSDVLCRQLMELFIKFVDLLDHIMVLACNIATWCCGIKSPIRDCLCVSFWLGLRCVDSCLHQNWDTWQIWLPRLSCNGRTVGPQCMT